MNNVDKSLLSILQRGVTHARALSLEGRNKTAADLLDALDNIPRAVACGSEALEDEIVDQLKTFKNLHPEEVTNYCWMLENRQSIF